MRIKKDSKRAANDVTMLPADTMIEVVKVDKDENAFIKTMSFGTWLTMTRDPNYRYSAFQYGFSSYPNATRVK